MCGGALGYLIGYAVFDQLARPMIEFYGYGAKFAAFQAKYQEWGLWIILIKGLTPIPYKIVTIASGAAKFDFWIFMAASMPTRGARFFIVATLLHFWGDSVKEFIERRLTLVTTTGSGGRGRWVRGAAAVLIGRAAPVATTALSSRLPFCRGGARGVTKSYQAAETLTNRLMTCLAKSQPFRRMVSDDFARFGAPSVVWS